METNNVKYMVSDIEDTILKLEGESRAILDISVYPRLSRMLETQRLDFYPTYYFPDTIANLLLRAKEDERYYRFILKLFSRWMPKCKSIDLDLLNNIFIKKEFPRAKIELITKEIVDGETYSFCYENFVCDDLVVELSPKFNLLGDMIGKILGFAKKSGSPILMMNQRLIRDVRGVIPIFETANMFVNRKQKFFSKFIPIKKTRGARWFIGITIGSKIGPVGFVFAVIDP